MPVIQRPFYVIGHNRNTLDEVDKSLEAGCNAIECDIQLNASGTDLCVNHGRPQFDAPPPGVPAPPGISVANPLVPYLQGLRARLAKNKLALMLFDVKIGKHPEFAAKLLSAIRTHLTEGTDLPILITVARFDERGFFKNIMAGLGAREGLGIDEEDRPRMVSDFFQRHGVSHHGFGDGISALVPGPNVRPSMEEAVYLKASKGHIKFVYSWTLAKKSAMREQLAVGVDGMIVDDVDAMLDVLKEKPFDGTVRLAKREDNPYVPTVPSYGLTIETGERDGAGTDAPISFTLHGDRGTVFKQVDAWTTRRFERGYTNFVTLMHVDVGTPQSLSVSHSDAGNGPDWFLDTVQVESRSDSQARLATFNRWIKASDGTVTRPLVAVEQYDLVVKTGDVGSAGTDAHLTFKLSGAKGSVSKTLDASPVGWFERNDTNGVDLTGEDIGPMQSLTLSHDSAGNGPGWFVDSVTATHRRTGETKTFLFKQWLEAGQPVTHTPAEATYVLTVFTADKASAGTDSNITFTLTGSLGAVSRTIDADPTGLFESGDQNTVHLFGKNIGQLLSVTVSHDNEGNGPGWFLDRIVAAHKGGPEAKTFHFNQWIDSNKPVTVKS